MSAMRKNIVITGMGAVTPIGIGVETYWNNLTAGACGIGEISRFDATALPVQRAGEIRDFQPRDFLPTRLVQDLDRFMLFAYIAAEEAVRQSGLDTHSARVGVVMGTALSGMDYIGETHTQGASGGRGAGPKFLLRAMGNMAAAQFAIQHGIQGPSMTVQTACSSGGDAITLAAMLLRAGAADAMLVMAGEAGICPMLIQSLVRAGALSKAGESLPFDVRRSGFVMGEGGGALVLERAETAAARGAAPLAALLGCANNTDAYNPVSPHPEGLGVAECIRLALADAQVAPEQVGYVNAHGTATPLGDIAETAALHRVFGADTRVAVSSTKGATGHMMGAGGVTEVIACVQALRTGQLPPNTGLTEQDARCALNLVTPETTRARVDIAISDAMGFGGQNSCIVVGKI